MRGKILDGFSPVKILDGIFADRNCRWHFADGIFADGILQTDFADGFFTVTLSSDATVTLYHVNALIE